MSDLIADFLAREQEQLGDIDDFKFDEVNNESYNNQVDDFETFDNNDFITNEIRENDSYGQSMNYNSKPEISMPRIEPEKILVWRREFEERIIKKDEEEKERMRNLERDAKKELEDWNVHHNEQLLNKRKLNRESQGVFVKERDQPIPGSEWQRVCKMCEFNSRPAVSIKPVVPGGESLPVFTPKDTSRMKSILLSLKTDPLIRA